MKNNIDERILTIKSTVHSIVRNDVSCEKQQYLKNNVL